MSNGYISMLVKGKNTHSSKPIVPSLSSLLAISRALNMSLDQLLEAADDLKLNLQATIALGNIGQTERKNISFYSGVMPIAAQRMPLFDEIACGKPIASRLKEIMSERNLRQIDIIEKCQPYCQKYGIKMGRNDLSQYLSGKFQPKQAKLTVLALALNVSEAWLMGYDVPRSRLASKVDLNTVENIFPITTQRIPLLGEIACGKPIFCNEDRESYVEVGTNIHADFCLRCKGDSMTGARIFDGDIVFIREQSTVDNGQVAAVIIGDEATLKRVYFYPEKSKLVLQAENPKYEPLMYVGEELSDIHILGKAVAFQSDVI